MYHSLFESLCMVPDSRIECKKIYPLDFLLLIVFLSTLSGNTSWYEIEDYAEEYEEELKSLYEMLTGHQLMHAMPSHDTLNRSISLSDVEAFDGLISDGLKALSRPLRVSIFALMARRCGE